LNTRATCDNEIYLFIQFKLPALSHTALSLFVFRVMWDK